jgi:hypothetical protein
MITTSSPERIDACNGRSVRIATAPGCKRGSMGVEQMIVRGQTPQSGESSGGFDRLHEWARTWRASRA